MLHYDRIGVSEGIDVDKTCASKECNICHYWYFLNIGFKFQRNVCNKCYDYQNIKGSDYCCIVSGISKSEIINLMKISIWKKKAERYKAWKFIVTYKNG